MNEWMNEWMIISFDPPTGVGLIYLEVTSPIL
jgi:hypothetical protein